MLQRIENFWNQVWRHLASYTRTLFAEMERLGHLNRCMDALWLSVVALQNETLQEFVISLLLLCNHPCCCCRGSASDLYSLGTIFLPVIQVARTQLCNTWCVLTHPGASAAALLCLSMAKVLVQWHPASVSSMGGNMAVCALGHRNHHTVRPQANRGISSYVPSTSSRDPTPILSGTGSRRRSVLHALPTFSHYLP